MKELQAALKDACQELFGVEVDPELTRPEEQFGDFSTKIAMQLSAKVAKPPREIAETLAAKIQDSPGVAKAEVAGPGFINFFLTDEALLESFGQEPARPYKG